METKKNKEVFFEVSLNWLSGTKGVLSSDHITSRILVTLPPEFGGKEGDWSPEHLFLGSISSCFLMTLKNISKKLQFRFSRFECETIGQVEVVDGRYKFTRIDLYPKATIPSDTLTDKAHLALQKTHKHCLITNSVNAEVYYHTELLIDSQVQEEIAPAKKPKAFTTEEAIQIGNSIGVDFKKYDLEEFRRGLEVEMEHGQVIAETNVTNDDELMTGKIAWAHLHEIPDYYTRLDKMEKEAELKAS